MGSREGSFNSSFLLKGLSYFFVASDSSYFVALIVSSPVPTLSTDIVKCYWTILTTKWCCKIMSLSCVTVVYNIILKKFASLCSFSELGRKHWEPNANRFGNDCELELIGELGCGNSDSNIHIFYCYRSKRVTHK